MADKLITSPEFLQAVNMAAKGKPEVAAKKLANSVVFVDFVKKAKLTELKSMGDRERWILQTLEAASSNNEAQANSR